VHIEYSPLSDSTATLNVANGSHGNILTEVDSPFICIDKETLSFRSEGEGTTITNKKSLRAEGTKTT
jgi:hypothetical protein